MKNRTYIVEVKNDARKEYLVAGWISRIKDVGKVKFVLLTDRSGTIQITFVEGKVAPALLEKFNNFELHDFLTVKGKIPEKVISKEHLELIPTELTVVSRAEKPLPIDVSGTVESELETRLNWRAVELRDPKRMAVLKVQAAVIEGMEKYLNNNGFVNAPMPSIMGVASEGGSEVFPVVYFDKSSFLRQDSQLFRQLLMVAGLDRVYEIGPNWRAELSHTPRHMCEFRACAVELSFIDNEEEVNDVEQRLVQATVKHVIENCKEELKLLGKKVELPQIPFPEFRFPQVYDILEKEFGKKIKKGEDLDHEAERMLGKYAKEKYNSDFYFINRFPSKAKPFYVMKVDEAPQYARSVDLEYKGVEISSGGQREHRYEKIVAQAKEKGLSKESTEWFTKFFKYGAPTHGGFSIGIERFVMQMLDIPNIFEVPAFARTPERLVP